MSDQDNLNNDPWLVRNVNENGHWTVLRISKEIPEGIKIKDFPEYACIYWSIQTPNKDFMPSKEELDLMYDFEDIINKYDGKLGWLMYSITGNQRKEWVWYVKEGKKFIEMVEKTASSLNIHSIKVGLAKADNWSKYRGLLKAVSG